MRRAECATIHANDEWSYIQANNVIIIFHMNQTKQQTDADNEYYYTAASLAPSAEKFRTNEK